MGDYVAKNMKLLDQSQIPSYHLQCIQRWLVFVLDMIVAGLVIVTMGLAVALRTKVNPGFLGIALIQLMTLSHELTGIVQSWTMLETSIGAITRIKDFAEKTPDESAPEETDAPTADWPSRGTLKFENVFATYGYVMVLHMGSKTNSDADFAFLEQNRKARGLEGCQLHHPSG